MPFCVPLNPLDDAQGGRLAVKGFRELPDGTPNPSIEAGVKVGDIIDQVTS